MQECEWDGAETNECDDYKYSKVKRSCLFFVKGWLNGGICTLPPPKKEAEE